MTRPELTPGEGGGKPAKPQPELPWYYSHIIPGPTPETPVDEDSPVSTQSQPSQSSTPSQPSSPDRPSNRSSTTPRPQPVLVPADLLDINPDAVGSMERHIAALNDEQPIAGFAQSIEQTPVPETDEFGHTPLTAGQAQHVDHLLTVETNSLAREVLITLKRDGLPPKSQWNEFMGQYALWSWDPISDAQALATLATIAESDWDEVFAYADEDYVETVAQDLGDDWIEGLVIIHAVTGDILLDITGVVTEDGSQYVGVQDTEVADLQGLPLIFVHNHRDTDASKEDLISAFDAGAKLLIVITRDGQEHVYVRGRDRMVKVREGKASYKVGPGTLDESLYLLAESQARGRTFEDDPPELIFQENQQGLEIKISGTMSFHVYDQHGRHLLHESFDDSVTHHALSKSRYDPYIVSIKLHSGELIKVDLQNLDDDVRINGLILPDLPTTNVDYYPSPTPEDVVQSFQESPVGTLEIFPIAQDPWATEIYHFADQHSRYNTPEKRHTGLDFFAPAGTEVISSSDGEVIGIYIPSRTDFEYDAYGTGVETIEGGGIMIDPRQLYPDIPAGNTVHRKNTISGMLTAMPKALISLCEPETHISSMPTLSQVLFE